MKSIKKKPRLIDPYSSFSFPLQGRSPIISNMADERFAERFFVSKTLDSPILVTPFETASRVLMRPRMKCTTRVDNDARRVLEAAVALAALESRPEPDYSMASVLCPSQYPDFWSRLSVPPSRIASELQQAEEVVRPMAYAVEKSLADMLDLKTEFPKLSFRSRESDRYYGITRYYEFLVESLDAHKSKGGKGPLTKTSMRWVLSPSLCWYGGMHAPPGGLFMSYEQVLMIKDMALSRHQALTAANLFYAGDTSLVQGAEALWRWQELMLTLYGNEGYELAKSTESLAKAYLSRLSGDILAGDDDSYARMICKVDAKELKILEKRGAVLEGPSAATLFHSSVLLGIRSLQVCVELFGLQKMCGHPIIDPVLGGLSAAGEARSPDVTLPSDAAELRNTVCRLFTETYIRRHGRWPKLSFLRDDLLLKDLYDSSTLAIARDSYPLTDWDHVRFEKMMDFEYYDNFLDIMDDKSISMYADEKHFQWDGGKPRSDRRLLIEILKRRSLSIRAIFETVESDQIPWFWKIVSLYPKEREFKLAARMFSMMVLEMRAFFAVHEANLGESVLPYFPQLTMVDEKLKIHERFLAMTDKYPGRETVRLLLELDLSRWNLRWRELAVHSVGRDLNDLFGLQRVYTTVHSFFKEATIMVRCAGHRPEGVEKQYPQESDLLWYGHLGGFEGIAQKLWSICTVGMIEKAVASLDLAYELTIQGDNVVMAVVAERDPYIGEREQLVELEKDILARCSESASSVNQELKPEECLSSTTVITYSKYVYINGVDHPTTLKSCSRLVPSSALDFPSVGSCVSAFFAGSYAAAENTREPMKCYYLACYHSARYLLGLKTSEGPYKPMMRRLENLSTPLGVMSFLTCPSELGGGSIIGPYSYLYKGGGDPLSKSLASLKMVQQHWAPARWWIHQSLQPSFYKALPSVEALIQDPYGLPVKKPVTPADAVVKDTLSVIKSVAINVDIKTALDFSDDEYKEKLIVAIAGLRPFNPVIARDLYDASVFGTVDAISRMFLKTRSLQQVSRRSGEFDIVSTLLDAGSRELNHYETLASPGLLVSTQIGSLYRYVNSLRDRWSPSGVSPVEITSLLPIDCTVVTDRGVSDSEVRVAFSCPPSEDPFWTRGPEVPYLGSRTREKRADHGYRIVGETRAASALKTLGRILSWSVEDPNLDKLIDHISVTRAHEPLTPHRFVLPQMIGGAIGHRYEARTGDRSASILGQSMFATRCGLDSNYAGFLSASLEDYPIMFQEFFLAGIGLLAIKRIRSPSLSSGQIRFLIVENLMAPLSGESLTLTAPPALELPTSPLGALVTDASIRLERIGRPVLDGYPVEHAQSMDHMRFRGLVDSYRQMLSGGGGAAGLLAGVGSRRSGGVGVAEACGAGGLVMLDAAAVALLETVEGVIHSPAFGPRINHSVNYLSSRFGAELVTHITSVLLHPKMKEDTLSREVFASPAMSYSRVKPTTLLRYRLARRCEALLQDTHSVYYDVPTVIFGSDGVKSLYAAILLGLRKSATRLVREGIIEEWEAKCLVGSVVKHSNKMVDNPEQAVTQAIEWMSVVKTTRFGGAYLGYQACELLDSVRFGRLTPPILATTAAASEVIRTYRGNPAVAPRAVFVPTVTPWLPVSLEPRLIDVVESPMSLPTHSHVDEATRWGHVLSKRLGRACMYGVAAYDAWAHASEHFCTEATVIVGSGLGATALVALGSGCSWTYGLDRLEDLPIAIHPARFKPLLITAFRLEHRFSEIYSEGGEPHDWWDSRMAARILSYLPDPFIICIDLPTSLGYSAEVLKPLLRTGFKYRLMIRIVAAEQEHQRVLAHLSQYGCLIDVITTSIWDQLRDRIYVVDNLEPGWLTPRRLSIVGEIERPPVKGFPTIDCAAAACFSAVGSVTGNTVRDMISGTRNLVDDLAYSGASRPRYSIWTNMLFAIVACDFLEMETDRDRHEYISALCTNTAAEVILREGAAPILIEARNARLITYLCRDVAPLVGHLDDPLET
nr:MAG: large protein [Armillaria cepistipes negative-stranded RNA virus 1]